MPSLEGAVVASGGSSGALDAVEDSVRWLEDHPDLNAGYGAVLNRAGEVELDAAIVDGARGTWGGVANVRFRNPVSLARLVMERTPHVLLAGAGAQEAGVILGLEEMNESTPEQHERWERERDAGRLELGSYGSPEHVDTVGAIALDDGARLERGVLNGRSFRQAARTRRGFADPRGGNICLLRRRGRRNRCRRAVPGDPRVPARRAFDRRGARSTERVRAHGFIPRAAPARSGGSACVGWLGTSGRGFQRGIMGGVGARGRDRGRVLGAGGRVSR